MSRSLILCCSVLLLTQTALALSLFGSKLSGNPEDQFARGVELLDSGKLKAAQKHFAALRDTWPESPEAAQAQLQVARLLDTRGERAEAFKQYQFLMDRYSGRFDYEEVLERQFAIADRVQQTAATFAGLGPKGRNPKAIPMFAQVVRNGPQWSKASEAQYRIGRIHELRGELDEAIGAYLTVTEKYPESNFSELADFNRGACMFKLVKSNQKDEAFTESAWKVFNDFLNRYPDSELKPAAFDYKQKLYERVARGHYDRAVYYDKRARKPRAALRTYQFFVDNFPASELTKPAKARISALEKKVKDNE